jgi:molybdate transport system substrate-binding protein
MRARLLAGAAALLLAACGGAAERAPAADPVAGELNVFAAASLTDVYNEIGQDFSKAHPDVHVKLAYGGSSTLVTQILQGAPADLFASADEANMRKLVEGGAAAGSPSVFAANRLEIAVPPGNPKRVTSLADLARPGTVVVLCAPAVPCGSYAGQALKKAGVAVTARSQEQDVKQVLGKVALGEADAGVVYATDVRAAGGRVEGVEIPAEQNVAVRYPIAQVRGAKNPVAARAFVSWILGARGQATLARFGFASP